MNNPYSDFYRQKYKGLNIKPEKIKSYADFRQIPFLTKKELLSVPFQARTFMAEKDIARISYSSGTTNKANPFTKLAGGYAKFWDENDLKLIRELDISKVLVLRSSSRGVFMTLFTRPVEGIICIPGDTANLENTAYLAKELDIQSIEATQTLLYSFIGYLKKVGFDNNKIKRISLGGEYTTNAKREFFQKQFPNAIITFLWGCIEFSGRPGFRCPNLYDSASWLFHLENMFFPEIEEFDNVNLKYFPQAGELIYTDIATPRTLPLIRYRTGDVASLEERECSCGADSIFRMAGRKDSDFFNYKNMAFHTQDIDDSLKAVSKYLEPLFQLNIGKRNKNGRELLEMVLKVALKEGVSKPAALKSIMESVEDNLNTGPAQNLKGVIKEGLVLPLKIEVVKRWPEDRTKSLNIISHL